MKKNNGRLPLLQFYLHRYLRLTPTYMFCILFFTSLFKHVGEGPLWDITQLTNKCNTKWWTNLLYINNFYPEEFLDECMRWSWYLANDFQFYCIAPLFLYAMYRFKLPGMALTVGSFLVASFIATGAIVGYYHFVANPMGTSPFAWALSLAWVIYVCHAGFGGLVDNILSARFWIPLSRLTYSVYLVHPMVLGAFYGSLQSTVAYTDFLMYVQTTSSIRQAYPSYQIKEKLRFPRLQQVRISLYLQLKSQIFIWYEVFDIGNFELFVPSIVSVLTVWCTDYNTFATPLQYQAVHSKSRLRLVMADNNANATTGEQCNCRNKDQCPLDNKCLTTSVIYNAQVTTSNTTKNYIGLTEGTFKQRFSQHKSTFKHRKHINSTELSKYIWQLKDKKQDFNIKTIISRARPYNNKSKRCDLCLTEKLMIIKHSNDNILNKRSELISKCRHENKFYLKNT
ncbi:Nose resistant to fluoxetine protein 6 [Exaiptasia diaphana]|nr:Nose resistant to fluoxetine protein 6 [Exaiptasia diaphana]